MSTTTEQDIDLATRTDLAGIEEYVTTRVHIADLIREGSTDTTQSIGWGSGLQACALSAAGLALAKRSVIQVGTTADLV